MATLDRVEPAYTPWTPSSAGIGTTDEEYNGRHRRLSDARGRVFSLRRLFYVARHRRR